jgi:PKD domain
MGDVVEAKANASPGGPYNADVGQTVTFNGSKSTGASGRSLTYAWDFGDGVTGTLSERRSDDL